MPTIEIVKIYSDGSGDYTDPKVAAAAHEQNLVANDKQIVFEMSGDIVNTTGYIDLGDYTTDATRNIVFRAKAGEEATGILGAGVTWRTDSFVVVCRSEHVLIDGIEIDNSGSTLTGHAFHTANNCNVINCVVQHPYGLNENLGGNIENSILINCGNPDASNDGIPVMFAGVEKCTFVNTTSATGGFGGQIMIRNNADTVNNTVVYNVVTGGFSNYLGCTGGDNNADSEGNACGTNAKTVTIDDFQDFAAGDYRLKTTSPLYLAGAGAVLSVPAVTNGTISITSLSNNACGVADSNGDSLFLLEGNCTGSASVSYRESGGEWTLLDDNIIDDTYSATITVNGQKDIEVRLDDEPEVKSIVTNISSITLVVAVAISQSNGAGRALNFQQVVTTGNNSIPMMYKNGDYSPLADPTGISSTDGSLWPIFAQHCSDAGETLLLVNVAEGSTNLSQWQKGGVLYSRISDFYSDFGRLDYVMSIIGENDSSIGTDQATVESQLNTVINDVYTDFGAKTFVCNVPDGDGAAWNTDVVRAAKEVVIANNEHAIVGSDLKTIDINLATSAGNDGVHIKSSVATVEAGDLTYAAYDNYVNAVSSTFNIVDTDAPDDTYNVIFWNIDTKTEVVTKNVTFSGGNATTNLDVAAGIKTLAYIDTETPLDGSGLAYRGVTE